MTNLGLLLFRVAISAIMILSHGLGKLSNPEPLIENVTKMGFPFPVINSYLAISAETIFPLLIILGLFARVSAIISGINMLIAAFVVHLTIFGDPFSKYEMAILYMISFFFIAIAGPGDWTVRKLFTGK